MIEKLLKLVGPVHVIGGLALFASGFVPGLQMKVLALVPVAPGFQWSPFFVAVLGPTIASWGVLFGALAHHFLSAPSESSWRAMLFAVLIWAPLDSALCLYYGVWAGAVVNVVVTVVLLVLLLAVRKRLD